MIHRLSLFILSFGVVINPASLNGAEGRRRINVGTQPVATAPLYLAIKEKYFDQLGLELNLIKFTSGPAQFAALAGGQIDLAWGGMGAFSLARANGQDVRMIALLVDYNPLQALVVSRDSPVKSVSDLAGRKVGLVQGSDAHYGLLKLLVKSGIPQKSVTILSMAPPQQVAALNARSLDAIYTWEPFITPVLESGGRELARLSDLNPGSSYNGYAGKKEWLEANGDAIERFLRGWDRGLQRMTADHASAMKAVLEFTGMSQAQARVSLAGLKFFKIDDVLNRESPVYWEAGSSAHKVLGDFQSFGLEAGLIKRVMPMDDFVMTRFVRAISEQSNSGR